MNIWNLLCVQYYTSNFFVPAYNCLPVFLSIFSTMWTQKWFILSNMTYLSTVLQVYPVVTLSIHTLGPIDNCQLTFISGRFHINWATNTTKIILVFSITLIIIVFISTQTSFLLFIGKNITLIFANIWCWRGSFVWWFWTYMGDHGNKNRILSDCLTWYYPT